VASSYLHVILQFQ